jgi:hypothetical protein
MPFENPSASTANVSSPANLPRQIPQLAPSTSRDDGTSRWQTPRAVAGGWSGNYTKQQFIFPYTRGPTSQLYPVPKSGTLISNTVQF